MSDVKTERPEPEITLEYYHEGKLVMISTHKIPWAKDESVAWTTDRLASDKQSSEEKKP
jgi:hypothetical protein